MALNIDQAKADDYLLQLVKAELKKNIKAELLKDLDPVIEAAAISTLASLETQIIQYADSFKGATVLKLSINSKDIPNGTRR